MKMQNLLNELKKENNFRELKRFKNDGKFVIFNDKRLLNFASNDYLGIASSGELEREFLKNHFALSSSASRSLGGGGDEYFLFEEYLSSLYKNEALLFSSGFLLNYSCLSALATLKNTLFLADKKVHASIIDGIKHSNFKRFKHNDINDLEKLLQTNLNYEKIIIICESLYSMDADFAPLDKLLELKKKYKNIMLYVDEAHSIGSLGINGLGLGHLKDIDFLVLTFGKSIASMGAAMICSKEAKDFFINKARGLIYSTALPPINVAYSHFVFSKLANFDKLREHLQNLSSYLNELLKDKIKGVSYIKMIVLGDNEKANFYSAKLMQKGFFAPSIKTPTVAAKDTGIRLSINASMDFSDLDNFAKAFYEI
ncbi:pyridoxal phosphate-dependent aminotransferase family protein [Campylobacter sp. 2018MI13]|nr:pyridoxal phosphate-dependent aminotransferase family protein [Campylobacter sp. 2018MI13]